MAVALVAAQTSDGQELQVGTVSNSLLEEVGFRLEVPPAGSEENTVSQEHAKRVAAQAFPENQFVDAKLAAWRNLRDEGPVTDNAVVWIVQSEPPAYFLSGGPLSVRDASEYSQKFHIDVIDAKTGEWLFGHDRLK